MLNTTQIPNSIVNDSSTVYGDEVSPYSYLKFVEFFSYEPSRNMVQLYNEYVDLWSKTKKIDYSSDTFTATVKDKYFELLRNIDLLYTSAEEKRFLTSLDLNNEHDRSLLIPYYVEKINDITNYFIKKRENIKFTTHKIKNLNSKTGVKDILLDFINDELTQSGKYSELSDYTISALVDDLEIDIVEKYDGFSHYYDIDPNTPIDQYDIKNSLLSKYFKNNTLEYDKIAFLDKDEYLLSVIREYPLYLVADIGFIFSISNDNADLSQCKPKDFITYANSNSYDDLNVNTYTKLTQKYAGVDTHYLSAHNGEIHTGVLIDAQSPYANTLNIKHTSIQNVAVGELVDIRKVGGFFIPTTQNISFYTAYNKEKKLTHNLDGVYYYPDPDLYGNVYGTSINKLDRYPYTWKTSLLNLYHPHTYSKIAGLPNKPYQDFHGYVEDNKTCTLLNKFESTHNNGVITKYNIDIHGNEYAMFKQKRYTSPDVNIITPKYNYNSDGDVDYSIYAGDLNVNLDCGLICVGYNDKYPTSDYENWDLMGSGYAYDVLIEGGLPSLNNLQFYDYGQYINTPNRPCKFDESGDIIPNYVSLNNSAANILSSCIEYDGGDFTSTYPNAEYVSIPYIANPDTQFKTITSTIDSHATVPANVSLYAKNQQTGDIYIRYVNDDKIINLSEVLSNITGQNFKNISNIGIIQDVLLITHGDAKINSKSLTCIKLLFDDNGRISNFINTIRTYTPDEIHIPDDNEYSEQPTNISMISQYFYVEKINAIIFAKLNFICSNTKYAESLDYGYTSNKPDIILPTITMLYLDDMHEEVLYSPTNKLEFEISPTVKHNGLGDVSILYAIHHIDVPILTYNSLNNLFTVTCMVYDMAGSPHIYNISFIHRQHKAEILSTEFMYAIDTKLITIMD